MRKSKKGIVDRFVGWLSSGKKETEEIGGKFTWSLMKRHCREQEKNIERKESKDE